MHAYVFNCHGVHWVSRSWRKKKRCPRYEGMPVIYLWKKNLPENRPCCHFEISPKQTSRTISPPSRYSLSFAVMWFYLTLCYLFELFSCKMCCSWCVFFLILLELSFVPREDWAFHRLIASQHEKWVIRILSQSGEHLWWHRGCVNMSGM